MSGTGLTLVVDENMPNRQVNELTQRFAETVRRTAHISADPVMIESADPAKTSASLQVGELVLTGVISASAARSLGSIIRLWISERYASSIKLRRGDVELTITGTPHQVTEALDRLSEVFDIEA